MHLNFYDKMKRTLIILFCALICSVSFAQTENRTVKTAPAGDTLSLNLNDCIEIAMTENLTVKIAGKEIEKQSYARKSTYSSLYPQIDATGSYQRTLKKQRMYMDVGGQTNVVEIGRSNTWNGAVTAAMPLINPQLWKTLQISDLDVELAVEKSRSSKLDMVATVTECFYTVLLAKKTYEIMTSALENAKMNYENIKHRYELGLSSEFDMLRAGVEVSSYEPEVFTALNAIDVAKWQLKSVIGIDLDLPLECIGNLDEYATMIHSSIDDSIQLENNTNIKQLDIQLDQMEKTVQLYKRAYLPTMALTFNGQIYAMDNTFDFGDYSWSPTSTVGVGLNVPIFSGMKRLNDIRKSKVQLTQLEIQKENVRRELYVSAKQVLSTMETCVKQYDAAAASVDQAIRGYNISVKRYDTGKGTILEVNDSRLAAIQANLTRDQAVYKYLVAKAAFDKIMGNAVE